MILSGYLTVTVFGPSLVTVTKRKKGLLEYFRMPPNVTELYMTLSSVTVIFLDFHKKLQINGNAMQRLETVADGRSR